MVMAMRISLTLPTICACLIAVCFVAIILTLRNLHRGACPRQREAFEESGLSASAYAMLDERCWLNTNVVADNSLGMVRHPTESKAGSCVLRGVPPGNGRCDDSNTALSNPEYAESVGIEDVDGRRECVVRMLPKITDNDARAYSDSMELDTVKSSDAYKRLIQMYQNGQAVIAGLQQDVSQSMSETAAANSNWRTQIAIDAASLANALGTQRDSDSQALRDHQNHANSERENAVANVAAERDYQVRQVVAGIDGLVAQAHAGYAQSNTVLQNRWLDNAGHKCNDYLMDLPTQLDGSCVVHSAYDPGILPCTPMTNLWVTLRGNLPNNDIAQYAESGIPECQRRCLEESACTHYSYNTGTRMCWLKRNAPHTGNDMKFTARIPVDK